jgi:hypothetical protein
MASVPHPAAIVSQMVWLGFHAVPVHKKETWLPREIKGVQKFKRER